MIKLGKYSLTRLLIVYVSAVLFIGGCSSAEKPIPEKTVTATASPAQSPIPVVSKATFPRGYQTTPQELTDIANKAKQDLEPYRSAMDNVLVWADEEWNFELRAHETCSTADEPAWNDNEGGTPIVYAKAMAYHLVGDPRYADELKDILQNIMTQVQTISLDDAQCQLNFAWGIPELVASADLIEDYWNDQTCTGPISTSYTNMEIGSGICKSLFQNWLAKNPYYIISLSAEGSQSNWGAAATTTLAYIADYLSDRPDVELVHRVPPEINADGFVTYSPVEAYAHANQLALDRMNGYGIEYGSSNSCDLLRDKQQRRDLEPVKSQITEKGIIPEDARREEYCNIPQYDGTYQNYPQLHLGHNIQQCELMLRRGDSSCFDNVDTTDIPEYTFTGPDGERKTTHLYPGRGSIERAIKAIIVDSSIEWRHDPALYMAYRYYFKNPTLPGFEAWAEELEGGEATCGQDACFGALTHGFAIEEEDPGPPRPFYLPSKKMIDPVIELFQGDARSRM